MDTNVIGGNMEKPFTIRVNDLHQEIIELLNNAEMPFYVLKNILIEIIKEIEDSDGKEISKYFNEIKEGENNGSM
jgi:hypothetical protein